VVVHGPNVCVRLWDDVRRGSRTRPQSRLVMAPLKLSRKGNCTELLDAMALFKRAGGT